MKRVDLKTLWKLNEYLHTFVMQTCTHGLDKKVLKYERCCNHFWPIINPTVFSCNEMVLPLTHKLLSEVDLNKFEQPRRTFKLQIPRYACKCVPSIGLIGSLRRNIGNALRKRVCSGKFHLPRLNNPAVKVQNSS